MDNRETFNALIGELDTLPDWYSLGLHKNFDGVEAISSLGRLILHEEQTWLDIGYDKLLADNVEPSQRIIDGHDTTQVDVAWHEAALRSSTLRQLHHAIRRRVTEPVSEAYFQVLVSDAVTKQLGAIYEQDCSLNELRDLVSLVEICGGLYSNDRRHFSEFRGAMPADWTDFGLDQKFPHLDPNSALGLTIQEAAFEQEAAKQEFEDSVPADELYDTLEANHLLSTENFENIESFYISMLKSLLIAGPKISRDMYDGLVDETCEILIKHLPVFVMDNGDDIGAKLTGNLELLCTLYKLDGSSHFSGVVTIEG